jgi:hypothetical protein
MSHIKKKTKEYLHKAHVILTLLSLLFLQDEHIHTLNIHCWMVWVSNILYLCVASCQKYFLTYSISGIHNTFAEQIGHGHNSKYYAKCR